MLKKSIKLISLIFFFKSSLFASVQTAILHDINTSFFSSKPHDDMIQSMTLKDIESNQTIMSEIDTYEKILPKYLEYSPIITTELYKITNDIRLPLSGSYHKMLIVSLLHLKTLDSKKDVLLVKKILLTHLKNLYAIIIGTGNMFEYLLALKDYEKIYMFIEKNPKYCSILLNNPPPDISEFLRVNQAEAESLFIMSKQSLLRQEDIESSGVGYEQLMTNVLKTFRQKYEEYDQKFLKALKANSSDEMKKFYKHLDKEKEELLNFSSKLSFFYEGLKVKLQNRYGFEVNTQGMADYMGRTIVLVAYPKKKENMYQQHIELLEHYNKLTKKCQRNTGYK